MSRIAFLFSALVLSVGCTKAPNYPELIAAQYQGFQPTDIVITAERDLSKKAKCGYVSAQFFEAVQRSLARDQRLVSVGLDAAEKEFQDKKLAQASGCTGDEGTFHVVEYQFPGENATWFMVFDGQGLLDTRGEVLKGK